MEQTGTPKAADVEEDITDILPNKCKSLEELLSFDRYIKGESNLSIADKLVHKKRRELLVSNVATHE